MFSVKLKLFKIHIPSQFYMYSKELPAVKVLNFTRYLISLGGQIRENKSLAKIDNSNTLINKTKLIRKFKSSSRWQTLAIHTKKVSAK